MLLPKLQNFIDGAFEAVDRRSDVLIDPSSGEDLGQQGGTADAALERALAAAARCHRDRSWFGLGPRRADYLLAIAARLERESEAIARLESLNSGVVISQTRFLSRLLPHIFKGAARQLLEHPDLTLIDGRIEFWHKPWGPALCLGPWNSPAPIGAHKLAAALAAGAPVILKPSEYTPLSTQKIFELIAACDLPPGAVQLVHGASREGAYLAKDSRIKALSFTGGLRVGQALAAALSPQMKPLQLELGGHNPFIVMPDASLEAATRGICEGMSRLNGQWCRAVGRILVPQRLKADLIAGVMERLGALKIGAANDEEAELGPLIHAQHRRLLLASVHEHERAGGRVWTAAQELPETGSYFAPRLISEIDPARDLEEMFGPVATVHGYQDASELAPLVNSSPYGLAAYIYGQDQDACFELARELEVGSTKINGVSLTSLSPKAPRVAWGWSGLGEEGDFESFRFFQGSTLIGTLTP